MSGEDEKGKYPLGNNRTDRSTEQSTNCRECLGSKNSFWARNFLHVARVHQAHCVHLLTQETILLFLRNWSQSYLLLTVQIQVYLIYSSTITLKNLSAYWEAQHSGWIGMVSFIHSLTPQHEFLHLLIGVCMTHHRRMFFQLKNRMLFLSQWWIWDKALDCDLQSRVILRVPNYAN